MASLSHQHEQLRQQLLKQKFQQANIQPSLTQNIQGMHCHQQQQHISSLPAQVQSSQQTITTLQGQWLTGKLPKATILQQSQQLKLQKNVLDKQQQLPLYQQNMSTPCQQPLRLQSDVRQQQMVRPQSELKLWTHQNPMHILLQPELSAAQQELQQTSQPIQLHQLHQSVIIDEQKQLHQSQRMLPDSSSASVDSTAQTEHACSVDWRDKAYQQLLSTREMYFPELIKLYQRTHELCCKPPNLESATKYEKTRILIEKMLKFLQLPRADMVHISQEKFYGYLKLIFWYLNSDWIKNPVSMQNHGQHQQPGCQSQIFQLQQKRSMKTQFHSVNPGSTSTLSGSPQFLMHQGVPNSQPNMINSFQIGSLARSEQRLNKFISNPHKSKQPMQRPMIEQKEQKVLIQKIFEVNDSKGRQLMGFSSGKLQQRHSFGQHSEYSPQPLLASTPCQLNAAFMQTSQHSSPQDDQINLFSPLCKGVPHLQSATSLLTFPSDSTPLTPSSIPVNIEKHSFGVSPVSIAENMEHPQLESEPTIQNQSLAICTPGDSASPLLTEFNPEGNQHSNTTGQPLERLLEVVKSISSRALSASIQDIESVFCMIDSCVATGEDLAADTSWQLQTRKFSLQYGSSSVKRMKRHISTMALDVLSSPSGENDSFKQFHGQISDDMESTATSRIKRAKIETKNMLAEIKEINQQLVETVIDVVLDSAEDATLAGVGEGTIVTCSYSASHLGENFKLQYASSQLSSILPVHLLVPADYPNSSPIILDSSSVGSSEQLEDLSKKAKARFNISLRKLSEPISLGEMAITWDACARAVFSEFAQSLGGEGFSSRYGMWENCIAAS
ncbi:hypothetical protein F0562_017671 [Nyssa sinensis]|uniref:ARC105/Med15 mediator subunit C-terminal domain-containing protein n=1 Tax=Nyssa sinensis TaxID=561372 RepID=A0A5J4ZIN7_9ASTE|nr:hypothetical protein F0562_017671 [Nyssa sinensis]